MFANLLGCCSSPPAHKYHLWVWTIENRLLMHRELETKRAAMRAFRQFDELFANHHGLGRLVLQFNALPIQVSSRLEDPEGELCLPNLGHTIKDVLRKRGVDPGQLMEPDARIYRLAGKSPPIKSKVRACRNPALVEMVECQVETTKPLGNLKKSRSKDLPLPNVRKPTVGSSSGVKIKPRAAPLASKTCVYHGEVEAFEERSDLNRSIRFALESD